MKVLNNWVNVDVWLFTAQSLDLMVEVYPWYWEQFQLLSFQSQVVKHGNKYLIDMGEELFSFCRLSLLLRQGHPGWIGHLYRHWHDADADDKGIRIMFKIMPIIKKRNQPEPEERVFLPLPSVWQGWSALAEGDLVMVMMIDDHHTVGGGLVIIIMTVMVIVVMTTTTTMLAPCRSALVREALRTRWRRWDPQKIW